MVSYARRIGKARQWCYGACHRRRRGWSVHCRGISALRAAHRLVDETPRAFQKPFIRAAIPLIRIVNIFYKMDNSDNYNQFNGENVPRIDWW